MQFFADLKAAHLNIQTKTDRRYLAHFRLLIWAHTIVYFALLATLAYAVVEVVLVSSVDSILNGLIRLGLIDLGIFIFVFPASHYARPKDYNNGVLDALCLFVALCATPFASIYIVSDFIDPVYHTLSYSSTSLRLLHYQALSIAVAFVYFIISLTLSACNVRYYRRSVRAQNLPPCEFL